jgi:hypothetical protein
MVGQQGGKTVEPGSARTNSIEAVGTMPVPARKPGKARRHGWKNADRDVYVAFPAITGGTSGE